MNKFITMIACLLISMGMSGHFLSKLNNQKENNLFSYQQNKLKTPIINNEFNTFQINNTIIKQKTGHWSDWSENTYFKDCEIWTPYSNIQTWGKKFKQTRICNIRKERTRPIYDIYQNGTEKFNSYEIDFKIVKKIEEQISLGTKNVIEKRVLGKWSQWSKNKDCKEYNHCPNPLKRVRIIYDIYSDGSKLAVDNETEYTTLIE